VDFIYDQNLNNNHVSRLCLLLVSYCAWLKNNSLSKFKLLDMKRHHSFALIWLIRDFSENLEKQFIFQSIATSREYLGKDPNDKITTWGRGLLCYHQAIHASVFSEPVSSSYAAYFQDQGIHFLLSVYNESKPIREEFENLYIRNRHFTISCSYGQLKDHHKSLNYYLEAKLHGELPSIESVISNSNLSLITSLFDFQIICRESIENTKERLKFLKDQQTFRNLKAFANQKPFDGTNNDFMNTTEPELTESAVLRAILTKSTLELLKRQDKEFDIRAFFEPVIQLANLEAKKRLAERMEYYELEPRREIPGDGNCQFSSLSDQLTNSLQHSGFIRKLCVSWLDLNSDTILENGAKVRDFMYDKDWDSYLAEMSRNSVWGDHLTLIAAAEVFNMSIVIVSSIPNEHFLLEINPIISNQGRLPYGKLYLSHLTELHYGSVQEKIKRKV